jgi:hypothetical protein
MQEGIGQIQWLPESPKGAQISAMSRGRKCIRVERKGNLAKAICKEDMR